MQSTARWPLGWVRALGALLGDLLFVLVKSRRHVALTNLRLCFPDLSEAERRALARKNFRIVAQTWLDRGWLWHAPPEVVRQQLTYDPGAIGWERAGVQDIAGSHFTRSGLHFA